MILVTRPQPGADETAARLAALGHEVLLAPASLVRPTPAHLPPPEAISGILVTSGNALPALGPQFHDVPLWAVGRVTASRAGAAGFRTVASADGDAAALAQLVGERVPPSRRPLLLVSGRGQGMDLAADLRRRGFRLLRRVVYTVEPARSLPAEAIAAFAEGSVSHALFFSAETARIFERLVRRSGSTARMATSEAVAISPRTAVALRSLPWRRISVADTPNQDALLAILP
ncbi:MAG: uroporphyrinogen-III synthase [Acetobacteraceae bacterium]